MSNMPERPAPTDKCARCDVEYGDHGWNLQCCDWYQPTLNSTPEPPPTDR